MTYISGVSKTLNITFLSFKLFIILTFTKQDEDVNCVSDDPTLYYGILFRNVRTGR